MVSLCTAFVVPIGDPPRQRRVTAKRQNASSNAALTRRSDIASQTLLSSPKKVEGSGVGGTPRQLPFSDVNHSLASSADVNVKVERSRKQVLTSTHRASVAS